MTRLEIVTTFQIVDDQLSKSPDHSSVIFTFQIKYYESQCMIFHLYLLESGGLWLWRPFRAISSGSELILVSVTGARAAVIDRPRRRPVFKRPASGEVSWSAGFPLHDGVDFSTKISWICLWGVLSSTSLVFTSYQANISKRWPAVSKRPSIEYTKPVLYQLHPTRGPC